MLRTQEVRDRSDGRRIGIIYRVFEEGRVSIANAPSGVADDKAVFPYAHATIELYPDEEPIPRDVPTYSLSDLILKPREGYGGHGVLVGPEAEKEEIKEAGRRVKEYPSGFVA